MTVGIRFGLGNSIGNSLALQGLGQRASWFQDRLEVQCSSISTMMVQDPEGRMSAKSLKWVWNKVVPEMVVGLDSVTLNVFVSSLVIPR
jgi:hypothetical protein